MCERCDLCVCAVVLSVWRTHVPDVVSDSYFLLLVTSLVQEHIWPLFLSLYKVSNRTRPHFSFIIIFSVVRKLQISGPKMGTSYWGRQIRELGVGRSLLPRLLGPLVETRFQDPTWCPSRDSRCYERKCLAVTEASPCSPARHGHIKFLEPTVRFEFCIWVFREVAGVDGGSMWGIRYDKKMTNSLCFVGGWSPIFAV